MRTASATMVILVSILATASTQKTVHVPKQFPTIQLGINNAGLNGTVLVDQGTYNENIVLPNYDVVIKSTKGPRLTIIDGGGTSKMMSVVRFSPSNTRACRVEGFTIRNGYGTRKSAGSQVIYIGGGFFCDSGTSATIANNIITGNGAVSTMHVGAGIAFFSANSPLVTGNIILNNNAYDGGGILTTGSSRPVIRDNQIGHNTALDAGGGIDVNEDTVVIVNNVIFKNTAAEGGGIYADDGSTITVTSNTVVNNIASSSNPNRGKGGGLYVDSSTSPNTTVQITNSIFWGNQASFSYSNQISPGTPGSTFNISYSTVDPRNGGQQFLGIGMKTQDPKFPVALSSLDDDYHLLAGSPCIDSGTLFPPNQHTHDFEGDPRSAGNAPDMGADEHHAHLYVTGHPTMGLRVHIKAIGGTSAFTFLGVSLFRQNPVNIPGLGSLELYPPFSLIPIYSGKDPNLPVFSINIPRTYAASIYLQALISNKLSNLVMW